MHPRNERRNGLAPGIQVTLDVLLPGERTMPLRQNSTQVNFCIRGSGVTVIGGKRFDFDAARRVEHAVDASLLARNDRRRDLQVRLTYSNAALLEKMNVHVVEENPPAVEAVEA